MDRRTDQERARAPVNPFAPPQVALTRAKDVSAVPPVVRRDGDLMLVGPDAKFLPICFVTGRAATTTVKVDTVWQPAWVYLTMLLGLIPYFFVSPWFVQHVSLRVPVGPSVIKRQKLWQCVGLTIAAISTFLCGLAVFISSGSLLLPSVAAICLGLFLALKRPVRLNIAFADRDLLVLRGVHAACLDPLPSIAS